MKADALAHIAVGSNIDPMANIRRGLAALRRHVVVEAGSRFYRTPPIGRDGLVRRGEPEFVNGMLAVRTRHAPLALRRILHQIEADCGRERGPDRYAPRTLDLDLVTHGGRIMDGDIPFRRFMAVPLLELCPGFELAPGTRLRDPGGLSMAPVSVPGLELPMAAPAAL